MIIGVFTDCYYPQVNGVVTSIINLESKLKQFGHDVYIIAPAVPDFIDEDASHIIRLFSIPFLKGTEFRLALFFKYTKAYNKVKNINFDIIHTQTEFTMGLFGKHIAKKLGIPIVHTYHTIHEEYTHYISKIGQKQLKRLVKFLSKKYTASFSGIIVPSEKTKKLLESYNIKNKIFIIPNGINIDQFTEKIAVEKILALKNKLCLSENSFKIIFVGRISKEKNIDMLVRSIYPLFKIYNIELIIVGDGPHKIELEDIVEELGVCKNVFFTDQIPNHDIPIYYKLADLFVSPSKTETQGLTIIEAMASNIPVLVYNDSNIAGIVIEQQTGLLFSDDKELTEKIEFAIKNKAEIKKYAEKGNTMVKEFSSKKFAEKIEKLYTEILRNK